MEKVKLMHRKKILLCDKNLHESCLSQYLVMVIKNNRFYIYLWRKNEVEYVEKQNICYSAFTTWLRLFCEKKFFLIECSMSNNFFYRVDGMSWCDASGIDFSITIDSTTITLFFLYQKVDVCKVVWIWSCGTKILNWQ